MYGRRRIFRRPLSRRVRPRPTTLAAARRFVNRTVNREARRTYIRRRIVRNRHS